MGGRKSGLTLIATLVVVAIISILASMAYPRYQSYMVQANRGAAQQFLMDTASLQHQYFLSNNGSSYASESQIFGGTGNGCNSAGGLISAPSRVCDFYAVRNILGGANDTFIVRAIPRAGKMQDEDGNLEVHHDGEKVGTWE